MLMSILGSFNRGMCILRRAENYIRKTMIYGVFCFFSPLNTIANAKCVLQNSH
jgi:hypothetical protein